MHCAVCHHSSFQFLFPHHHNWQVHKCSTCGLVQVGPLPSKKDVASFYHHDMDHFAPYLAQIVAHRAYFRQKIQKISSTIHYPLSTIHLLDIGCALGVLLEEAKKSGWKAMGVDRSIDAVSYCKKKGLNAVAGTARTVRGSFDVITACEVIEHERDPLGMIQSIYTLLNPGGIALITTPNHSGWGRKLMGRWWPGYQHPEHLFFFDHESIMYLLKKVGFTSVEVTNDPPRPFPISFLFTRAGDYFPWLKLPLKAIGKLLDGLKITNPINPWNGMMVVGIK